MNELDLAKSAFVAARGRFQEALNSQDISLWYAGLREAIWWIVALDEHYYSRYGRGYKDFRDASQYGRQVPGIRYARNAVGHHIALLLEAYSARPVELEADDGADGVCEGCEWPAVVG